jgi:hypothetical protein
MNLVDAIPSYPAQEFVNWKSGILSPALPIVKKSVQDGGGSTAPLILNKHSWHAWYYFRYYKHTYSTANSSQHADPESGPALAWLRTRNLQRRIP